MNNLWTKPQVAVRNNLRQGTKAGAWQLLLRQTPINTHQFSYTTFIAAVNQCPIMLMATQTVQMVG